MGVNIVFHSLSFSFNFFVPLGQSTRIMKTLLNLLSVLIFCLTDLCAQSNELNINILTQIRTHYRELYGKETRLEESTLDSIYNMRFRAKATKRFEETPILMDITIPRLPSLDLYGAKPILEGDLGPKAGVIVLVTVHTEGGGTGSNSSAQELFLFGLKEDSYKLLHVYSEAELSGCDNGWFRAKRIEDGLLLAEAQCFAPKDPRCCPSQRFALKLQWESGGWQSVSRQRR